MTTCAKVDGSAISSRKGLERLGSPHTIPERLQRLPELATDLWWTWNTQAREVFRKLDYPLWRQTAHNPVLMLQLISQEMLNAGGGRRSLPRGVRRRASTRSTRREARATPGGSTATPTRAGPIAYFSAEFALHQSLPIYAGGLGVLAGDHCKEASDLGIPADRRRVHVSAGLLPPERVAGRLAAGDLRAAVVGATRRSNRAMTPDGKPCIVAVPLGNRSVLVSVWRVRLGRVKLYLLDTDLEENAPWDRELSARLYGGDRETRVQQEIILGIGGVRALKAMGIYARGLAPERRARGVRRPAAHPRSDRARADLRRGARGGAAHDDLHDAHAGAGRARRVSLSPGRDAPGGRVGHARQLPRRVPGARPLRQRQRAALQHDRARAAHRRRDQRASASCTARSRATCGRRSGRASPTTSGRCAPSPTASTCRPGCRPK